MAQHAVEKVEKHDFGRTGRMALYGGGTSCSAPEPRYLQTQVMVRG